MSNQRFSKKRVVEVEDVSDANTAFSPSPTVGMTTTLPFRPSPSMSTLLADSARPAPSNIGNASTSTPLSHTPSSLPTPAPPAIPATPVSVAITPPTDKVVEMVRDMTNYKARVPKQLLDAVGRVEKVADNASQVVHASAMADDAAMKELLMVTAVGMTGKLLDKMRIDNAGRDKDIYEAQTDIQVLEEELHQGMGAELNESLVENRQAIAEHGEAIEEHGEALEEHGETLEEHDGRILNLQAELESLRSEVEVLKAKQEQREREMEQLRNLVQSLVHNAAQQGGINVGF
ncbi:hypothetical protein QBC41DRAFT_343719 [Cercophora samala]|uniref:Uncharacterized protein n=1 Tax=Cercophora samala TaxID=330535 RepID=A0AA39ZKE7_9PEZI|nr:hypothetical protein QBC41DRAFT_343719 [Cercophora samala]